MTENNSWLRRHRLALIAVAALVIAGAAAVPLTAYVVIPAFVRSTVVENVPGAIPSERVAPSGSASASSSAADANKTISTGDLKRISPVDFGTGRVLVLTAGGKTYVRFDQVEIAAAPNMHVYLSDHSDGTPGAFTDLGTLKATSGSFNYEIPAGVDLATTKSVVVWCLQFKTTITYAVLQAV